MDALSEHSGSEGKEGEERSQVSAFNRTTINRILVRVYRRVNNKNKVNKGKKFSKVFMVLNDSYFQ